MEIIKTKSFELAVCAKGDRSSLKLALVLPGRLDTKDYSHTQSHAEYLASRGYFAVSFDPPGTWESPGEIELYTMTNYLKAVNELIELFGSRPTLLMGHSRGGNIAMLAGLQNECVTHIVCTMPPIGPSKIDISDATGGVRVSYRNLPPCDAEHQKEFRLPLTYFKDEEQYNMLDGLQNHKKPKLFFLGLKDDVVRPEEVRAAYEASAEPKRLHELNSDHDYWHHQNFIDEVNQVTGKFLDEY